MIRVSNLTKRYGTNIAVDSISFGIRKGEIVGFLGPNGAGKTTTMRILTSFLAPDEGTAVVAGFDVLKEPLEVRKRIGYLPENAPLYLDMGVFDYLNFIAEIRDIPRGERGMRIKNIADICGLDKNVQKRYIYELSKGYRQRVCLAQALIHDPDILILDEPTIGLDPNQIIEIRQLIKEIGIEKTVILSSHILSEVSATCGRVLIINQGKIIASGTPEELSNKTRGKEKVYINLKGEKEAIETKLHSMSGITSFRITEEDGGELLRYEIESDGDANLNEALFHMAVDNRWVITELRKERASLEDVFLQLTTGER
ncbi:MAG: ATP-binding cassette domain-containing protein [Nitrospinae bacterium]|nr:ATP-binding cassette domain-containing protein [Nitrospinota bacterium]